MQLEYPDADQELGQYIPLHYHYVMLQDDRRVSAFQTAINKLVVPGMRVVELGGGTGILSSFAARRGANVTCVERNSVLAEQAKIFLGQNDLSDRVKVVSQDAMDFVPDEPVEVVVCEMLHVAMLRERQIDVIESFKRNYRERFGADVRLPIFIPEASVLMVQAVEQDYDFAGYWAPVPLFQSLETTQDSTQPACELSPYQLLNYDCELPQVLDCEQTLQMTCERDVNAIRFVTQNVMMVDVEAQNAISWPNHGLVLPLGNTFRVCDGDNVSIKFSSCSGGTLDELSRSLKLEVHRQRNSDQYLARAA